MKKNQLERQKPLDRVNSRQGMDEEEISEWEGSIWEVTQNKAQSQS